MFCRQCGAEVPQGAKFCKKCGAAVSHQAQGSVNQATGVTTKVVAKRKPMLPLVIGATCTVLLLAGLYLVYGFITSGSRGSQPAGEGQFAPESTNINTQYSKASGDASWIADAVKFENAAIKLTSYGYPYLTVDIHNTSDYYVPYVWFKGTVDYKGIDDYGEEVTIELEIPDIICFDPFEHDSFISEVALLPQEVRTATYLLGGTYFEAGKEIQSKKAFPGKNTVEKDGFYYYGSLITSDSYSNLKLFHYDPNYETLNDDLAEPEGFSTFVDSYAARKLTVELSDLKKTEGDDYQEISGTVKFENTTPYYLKSYYVKFWPYNAKGEKAISPDYRDLPIGSDQSLAPGESTEVSFEDYPVAINPTLFSGTGHSRIKNPDMGVKELRVLIVKCEIDKEKCAEKGIDVSIPADMLK